MHLSGEKTGAENDQRHGNQNEQCQCCIDVRHESDRRDSQHDRIGQSHHTHAACHPDVLDVIGGMCHEFARFHCVEVGSREGLYMSEKLISKSLFHSSRRTDEASPPHITEKSHHNGNHKNIQCIAEQAGCVCSKGCQIIDGPFDDTGDKELQKINDGEAKDSRDYDKSVFEKIGFYQL